MYSTLLRTFSTLAVSCSLALYRIVLLFVCLQITGVAEVDIFRMMQRWIEYNRTSSTISAATNSIAADVASGGNSSFPAATLNEGAALNASAPSSEPSSSSTTLSVSSAAAIGGGSAQRRISSQLTIGSASASVPSSALRPEQVDRLLGAVRLHLMSVHELLTLVRPTRLFSGERLLDAIQVKDERRDTELNYRGVLLPEENVASQRHGAQVIRGELKNGIALLVQSSSLPVHFLFT